MRSDHAVVPPRTRTVDVHVLGTVEVRDADGRALDIGGPMPRLALVRLALDAGEVVSTETLVDTLWGDDPPPTARRSLQSHVAKLRAALGADDGPLHPCRGGYVLRIDRSDVDVLRIEDRLELARELISADPARARELIAACRADWGGDPFVDLADRDTLVGERERLARLRDELADAELDVHVALGDPAAAIVQLERAVVDDPTHEPNWIRLVSAYYGAGRQRDALEAYRRASDAMLEHLGVDPSPRLRELELQILRQEVVTDATTCPYKGLAGYQIIDGPTFHGRSDTTDEIIELVRRSPIGIVIGPSGVGKSSVLRAGVAYRIVSGRVPGLRTVSLIAPGANPLRSLYGSAESDLLIVDQFEELFTLGDDEDRRREFVDELIAIADTGRARVLLSVRADFFDHCLSVPGLAEVLGSHLVIVGALTRAGVREAVLGPATQADLLVEPELIDLLVDDVADRPGALPLLSHALSETWRRRTDSTLTVDAFRASGSIAGSISATAERVYAGLDSAGRRQIERLFRRLVEPGADGRHSRRIVARAELDQADFDPDLIEMLVGARLLTATTEDVQIAHEALIEAWPRLHDWIDAARDWIVQQQRLSRATRAWLDSDRDDGELYRGNKLATALAWRREMAPGLTPDEAAFLDTSERLARDELDRQRRTNRRLRLFAIVSLIGLLSALVASFVAVRRGLDADRRRVEAEADALATAFAADETLSAPDRLRIATALLDRTPTAATADFMLRSMALLPHVTTTGNAEIIAVPQTSPAGASGFVLHVVDEHARPAVLDPFSLELVRSGLPASVAGVVRTTDRTLAIDGETFEVVDVATGTPIGPQPSDPGTPASVSLSADGTMLALAEDRHADGAARITLVDVASGATVRRFEVDADRIGELEFDRAGARLTATLDASMLQVWQLPSGAQLFHTDQDTAITASAFDPSGTAVAVGHDDGTIEVWRSEEAGWRFATDARAGSAPVSWVEFGPDGRQVVSSDTDGLVAIWDAVSGAPQRDPVAFETSDGVASFFEPGGDRLVTIDSLGRQWIWSPAAAAGLAATVDVVGATSPPAGDTWFALADGDVVSVSGGDVTPLGLERGALAVHTGRGGDLAVVFEDRIEWRRGDAVVATVGIDDPGSIGPIALASDRLAVYDADLRTVRVLAEDGSTIAKRFVFAPREVVRLDLGPSGSQLVYSTDDGETIWKDLETTRADRLLATGLVHDAHFVDDDLVVAVGEDGVRLIDVADRTSTSILVGRGADRVAISPDLATVATVGPSGELTLWDVESGRQIGPAAKVVLDGVAKWVEFDGDDHLLVGGERATARLPLAADEWVAHACAVLSVIDPGGVLPTGTPFADEPPC